MIFSDYTKKEVGEVLDEFKVDPKSGLSLEQVQENFKRFGANELKGKETTAREILLRQFKSPFVYLLIFAALISLALRQPLDGILIFIFVGINSTLGFYQEFKSHQALKLLEKYIASQTKVIREANVELIDSRQLVPGDIVLLSPGDIIRADIRIIESNNLFVDESTLTGESTPSEKTASKLSHKETEIFKAKCIGFSGTTVVSGEAKGVVVAGGMSSAIGSIAKLTYRAQEQSTFEKNMLTLSRLILRLVITTLIVVVIANLLLKGNSADFPELIVFAIALAVSVIPEALPIVTTFSLSRGAIKLAKNKVVVKRLSAIEDLGSVEVLCTDKTGTLTENRLKVQDVFANDKETLKIFASLTSDGGVSHNKIDPFDYALWEALSKKEKRISGSWKRISELPFDPQRKRNAVCVTNGDETQLIVRGAIEEITKICVKDKLLATSMQWSKKEGKKGRRVIAIAAKLAKNTKDLDIVAEEKEMRFIGAVSFSDPLKETAKSAVDKAKRLGIRVVVLTGDAPEVAGTVAQQIGLISSPSEVLTGEEFEDLSEVKKRAATRDFQVFARTSPEQKFSIIKYLQEKAEVGYLGEGINDAPALKIADVALVVQGAADIAKDTADIVLLKKSLEVIINGIEEGRSVFENTIKYIRATLTSNLGNFFAIVAASFLIPFLPMLPLQILLLNLLSDFPMISVATDNVEPEDIANPKRYEMRDLAFLSIILGLVSTTFDFIFFALFNKMGPSVLQTNWFIGSVLTELILLFSVRTRKIFFMAKRASNTIIILTVLTVILTITLPFTSFGQKFFSFVAPSNGHLILIMIIAATYFATTEFVKRIYFSFTIASTNERKIG